MDKIAVGKWIYLWSGRSSKPHEGSDQATCIISAHGVQQWFGNSLNRSFTVRKDTELVFYAPHGYTLEDPGIGPIANKSAKAFERYKSGSSCPNYTLTKFQGYHGEAAGAILGIVASPFITVTQGAETYQLLKNRINYVNSKGLDERDILTIRYHPFQTATNLSDVLDVMWNNGYRYREYHCSFCRPSIGGAVFGQAGSHNIKSNS